MNALVTAYVSRTALRHNLRLLMGMSEGVPLCAMVKANAYGHGLGIVAPALSGMGVSFWGVACVEEALSLATLGTCEPILVLQPACVYDPERDAIERADLMIERQFRATVADENGLDFLAARAKARGKNLRVHVKLDTGMGRNGCPSDAAVSLILKAARAPGVVLEGVYSHLACADEPNLDFAREQIALFRALTNEAADAGARIPCRHISNSAAAFNLPQARMDMIRPGLALYGYGGKHIKGSEKLMPSLRVAAPVLMVKNIAKGKSSGYGATFVARRDTRAGLLPLGYADGYSRKLSNSGVMEARGKLVPVIGRISMDFTMVDITDAPEVEQGTEICVISNAREAPNSVESLAVQLDTIPYEITSVLGSRVQRVAVE